MNYKKHPDNAVVNDYIKKHEPLIIAIPFDYESGGEVLMSLLDDSFEHHILLAHRHKAVAD